MKRYEEGDSYVGIEKDYIYFLNPFANEVYYYQIELDSKAFMAYAKRIDTAPTLFLPRL